MKDKTLKKGDIIVLEPGDSTSFLYLKIPLLL